MVVYVGQTSSHEFEAHIARLRLGRIWTSAKPRQAYEGEPLAVDNGAYSAWRSGKEWSGDKFLRHIDRVHETGLTPDWVVIPDVVGDGRQSIAQSWKWVDRIPDEWPKLLALQDGYTLEAAEHFAPLIAGVFLGGLPQFQWSTAHDWLAWCRERDLVFHWGGVGKLWELKAAHDMGADSVDSSQMLWSRRHWQQWERAYGQLGTTPVLLHEPSDTLDSTRASL